MSTPSGVSNDLRHVLLQHEAPGCQVFTLAGLFGFVEIGAADPARFCRIWD